MIIYFKGSSGKKDGARRRSSLLPEEIRDSESRIGNFNYLLVKAQNYTTYLYFFFRFANSTI